MGAARVRRGSIRRASAIAAALLVLSLAACGSGGDAAPGNATSPEPPDATATAPAPGAHTIETGDRSALLYVPDGLPADEEPGLVVVLHGYTGEAASTVDFVGLLEPAADAGLVVLAPQGTTDGTGNTFWDASDACCGFGAHVDDSGYLSGLIDDVVDAQGIDPGRVYVVGHSNGGFMAHRMACEHAGQVAAIASLAGTMDSAPECEPSGPVSVLQVHGTADDVIFFAGGLIAGFPYLSAEQAIGWWREADGCADEAGSAGEPMDADVNVPGDDLVPTEWTGCGAGTTVALWTIEGGGHVPSLTSEFAAALVDWLESQARDE